MTTLGEAPPAWKAGACCYGPGLNLEKVKKMLEAGEKEALKQGVPVAMAICDSGGNLMAFHRMDNAMLVSTQISPDKAYTSVLGKMPTGNFAGAYRSGELVPLFYHERWITFHGGYPLIKDGVLMGGLGVSGGVIEDNFVALAILKAGGFVTADAEALIKDYQSAQKKEKTRQKKS